MGSVRREPEVVPGGAGGASGGSGGGCGARNLAGLASAGVAIGLAPAAAEAALLIQQPNARVLDPFAADFPDEGVTQAFDVNLDGTPDFELTHRQKIDADNLARNSGLDLIGLNGTMLFLRDPNAVGGSYDYAEASVVGDVIGPGADMAFTGARLLDSVRDSSGVDDTAATTFSTRHGEFDATAGQPGYVAFAFLDLDANTTHYGYLQFTDIDNDLTDFPVTATLAAIVFETTPHTPVTIGLVPEPAGLLAMLGAGAAAMGRRRGATP